jgi:rubrerythrin
MEASATTMGKFATRHDGGQALQSLREYRVLWIEEGAGIALPETLAFRGRNKAVVIRLSPEGFAGGLIESDPASLALVVLHCLDDRRFRSVLQALRDNTGFNKTRVIGFADPVSEAWEGWKDEFDVEKCLKAGRIEGDVIQETFAIGILAFQSLRASETIKKNYLDSTHNEIFDWFENTRWSLADMPDFAGIQKELLRPNEIDFLRETVTAEFGTLPALHNFLREWGDEYSFSSWASAWGAEESRHALMQSRYLRAIGVETPAKHALYKRKPYPLGENRAGTLMLNMVAESRASEYYRRLSEKAQEPVLKQLWMFISRDEARHARAFKVFCEELCDLSEKNTIEAVKMAYIFLGDVVNKVKHPVAHFYPHSTSNEGFKEVDEYLAGSTEAANSNVIKMVRSILKDTSIHGSRDLKRWLRENA